MPLLYEGSRQAEFLKPTVITLTYGLAFGMVLVLLVVPALIAVQSDLGRMTRALRRAPPAPAGPVGCKRGGWLWLFWGGWRASSPLPWAPPRWSVARAWPRLSDCSRLARWRL